MKRFFRAAQMDELGDLTDLAEQRITGIGAKIRANLIPPLWRSVPDYRRQSFRSDLVAGLTIAALTIPQAIAFALLIGIPVFLWTVLPIEGQQGRGGHKEGTGRLEVFGQAVDPRRHGPAQMIALGKFM